MAPQIAHTSTTIIEGMGSLIFASGAHVIKLYHSFTIRRD